MEVDFIKNKMVNLSNLGHCLLIGRQSRVIVDNGLQHNFRVAPTGVREAVDGGGGLVGGRD